MMKKQIEKKTKKMRIFFASKEKQTNGIFIHKGRYMVGHFLTKLF